jgi:hypothetical protein
MLITPFSPLAFAAPLRLSRFAFISCQRRRHYYYFRYASVLFYYADAIFIDITLLFSLLLRADYFDR